MNELLAQLWTPELQSAFTVVVVLLVILYVLSIVWVVRDAYLRGSYWYVWAHRRARAASGRHRVLPAASAAAADRPRRARARDRPPSSASS